MLPMGLIGYTGFVGSNLFRQGHFDKVYNSKNISEIRGEQFKEIWCAGVTAVKWWANKNPEADWKGIQSLLHHLMTVKAEHFVLISTIDVYSNPVNVDEHTPIETSVDNAYGLHRHEMEQFVQKNFDRYTIIRLPALFGDGLKKNAVYDILHNNQVEKIHSGGVFQFYSLDRVHDDIRVVLGSNVGLMNFATEPMRLSDLFAQAFGIEFSNEPYANPRVEDVRTRYAHLFGAKSPYILQREQIIDLARAFALREKQRLEAQG